MAIKELLLNILAKYGNTATILRTGGDISEKCILMSNKFASKPYLMEYQKDAYFSFDSQIVDGDVFRDSLSNEYYIVATSNVFGKENITDGIKALCYKCNAQMTLYQLSDAVVESVYGKREFTPVAKKTDYASVSYFIKGDRFTVIGDMPFDQMIVLFSARNLSGYIPRASDRIVLDDGLTLQIDGIDPYLYTGNYEAMCSLDKRV